MRWCVPFSVLSRTVDVDIDGGNPIFNSFDCVGDRNVAAILRTRNTRIDRTREREECEGQHWTGFVTVIIIIQLGRGYGKWCVVPFSEGWLGWFGWSAGHVCAQIPSTHLYTNSIVIFCRGEGISILYKNINSIWIFEEKCIELEAMYLCMNGSWFLIWIDGNMKDILKNGKTSASTNLNRKILSKI